MSTAVAYSRLSPLARYEIRSVGLTIAGYVRHHFPDGVWGGDRCGCTDDQCVGYHHDAYDDCQCLPALLESYYLEVAAPVVWTVEITGGGKSRGVGPFESEARAEEIAARWRDIGHGAVVRRVER